MECNLGNDKTINAMNTQKLRLLGDTFGKVKITLDTVSKHGEITLKNVKPHVFNLIVERNARGGVYCSEGKQAHQLMTLHCAGAAPEMAVLIDTIGEQDQQKLGKMHKDEKTDEVYMLMPVDIHMTLDVGENPLPTTNEDSRSKCRLVLGSLTVDQLTTNENEVTLGAPSNNNSKCSICNSTLNTSPSITTLVGRDVNEIECSSNSYVEIFDSVTRVRWPKNAPKKSNTTATNQSSMGTDEYGQGNLKIRNFRLAPMTMDFTLSFSSEQC